VIETFCYIINLGRCDRNFCYITICRDWNVLLHY